MAMDINGMHFEYDSNGNPNIGYDVVEWRFNNSVVEFIDIGSFDKNLTLNKTRIKWHTHTGVI